MPETAGPSFWYAAHTISPSEALNDVATIVSPLDV